MQLNDAATNLRSVFRLPLTYDCANMAKFVTSVEMPTLLAKYYPTQNR
jgi:hypothetical protein